MNRSLPRVELLDYLRGVAIIAVLFAHTLSPIYGYDEMPWSGWFRDFSIPEPLLFVPISVLRVGICIFFVVSGFCIHLSFQKQGQEWKSFFIRRFFRIYPAYFVALIFFALLLYSNDFSQNFHSLEAWKQFFTHLFLIHNFAPNTYYEINGSFWSLAIEAQLYLLYPVVLFLAGKFGWRRTIVILAAIEIGVRGMDGLVETLNARNTITGHIVWSLAASPFAYWFSWSIGAFVADAFIKKQPLPFAKMSFLFWLALGITCYFIKPLYPFRFMLYAVMTAAIITKFLHKPETVANAPSIFLKLLGRIGLWSYSIYLLHQPLLNLYSYSINAGILGKEYPFWLAFIFLAVTWPLVIFFSILFYKTLELPGIAVGKQIIRAEKIKFSIKGSHYFLVGLLLFFIAGNFYANIKLIPQDSRHNNNQAWLLATSYQAAKRNGLLAVQLAETACRQTSYREIVPVGTLAAAYAEAGRFDDAIATAQLACDLAAKNGETNLLKRNLELLSLYKNHQPYHELPPQSLAP